jgi:hypothetical protein
VPPAAGGGACRPRRPERRRPGSFPAFPAPAEWDEAAMAESEPRAVRRRAGLDPAASGPVLCRPAPRPGRPEHPSRRCPPAPRRGRPVPRRPSAAPGRRPPVPRWVRRRLWLPGQTACPAPRPSDPWPGWRARLVCPVRAPPPRLRRRQPRGGRRGRPSGARAGTVPWAGLLGGRQGPRAQVAPAVAPRRRVVAWAARPWDRAPQAGGRQERRGARDGDADGPQDRPGRAAYRARPAVRGLGGFVPARESISPGPAAARRRWAAPARRWAAPARRRWTPPAGPQGPESVGLALVTVAVPRPRERVGLLWATVAVPRPREQVGRPSATPAWPRRPEQAGRLEATPAWPRPTASVWPRLQGPAWLRLLGPVWPELTAPASARLPAPASARLPALASPRLPVRAAPRLPALAWPRPVVPASPRRPALAWPRRAG